MVDFGPLTAIRVTSLRKDRAGGTGVDVATGQRVRWEACMIGCPAQVGDIVEVHPTRVDPA